ncbi:MAG: type I secretion protein TolC [Methylophilaceae bacterium 17-44-8]|nr:MAG: type I secretion protein TolC [Methylophilales bacterium 28-44-11]OYZ11267.1 MAG: type I secretion protein TolC [Methylophilales bacterium 16-45-7]OZA05083.1 MAG: type I secretion protein TolC [Methylophilaceae bacterium 17-44-8]
MIKKRMLAVLLHGLLLSATTSYAAPILNLLDVYQEALAHDPTLASATNTNRAAQEAIEQAKANYRPNVNFTAGASGSRTNIKFIGASVFRSAGRASFEGYNYQLEARQPIYRKDSLVQIDQSKIQVSQADKQLHLTQQNLMLRTTQAYFDVLIAQDRIGLIQAQKAAILSQLDQANATFEVGTATITDVNEAQARYDLVVSQEIAAENEFEIAKRALQAITGRIPEKLATVKSDIQVVQLSQGMNDWQDVALASNLNIQIQQDAFKLAEQDIERANAGHMPTLDAVASFTNNYSNGSPNGFGSDLENTTVGFELQIPLYQGGAVTSRVRQAVYNKQRAQDEIEVAKRQTDLETQRAYLNLSSSIAQVKALEQALISSQSQLDSTKLGYEVGVRTSVDVLNAQQQLFSAKRDLLQARYNYLVNIIRLKSATGVVSEADLADINQQLVAMQTSQ